MSATEDSVEEQQRSASGSSSSLCEGGAEARGLVGEAGDSEEARYETCDSGEGEEGGERCGLN